MQVDLAGHDAARRSGGAVLVDGVLGGGNDGGVAVEAQIVVARKADQALFMTTDDAVADAIARLEERIFQAGGLHVVDTAAQRTITGKIVNDALALGLLILGRGHRMFSGRRMRRHCPSIVLYASAPRDRLVANRSITGNLYATTFAITVSISNWPKKSLLTVYWGCRHAAYGLMPGGYFPVSRQSRRNIR